MKLGEKIHHLRRKAGLSQEGLAELLGVSRQAVSKWETGEAAPEISKLLALSKAFGVTTDWLLDEDSGPEEGGGPAGAEQEDDAPEPPPAPLAPNWVDSIPGVIGRLIRTYGWLLGVRMAIGGAVFVGFSVIVRVLSRSFFREAGNIGFTGFPGDFGSPGLSGGFGDLGVTASVPGTGLFSAFANVILIVGIILIISGVALAVALKKYGGRK